MRPLIFFILTMLSAGVYSQASVANPVADSLEHELAVAVEDSTKLRLLQDLMDQNINVNPRKCIEYAELAMVLASDLSDPKALYQAQYFKSAGFLFLGQYDSAEVYALLCEKGAKAYGLAIDIMDILNLLGSLKNQEGDYPAAIDYYQEGLQLSIDNRDTSRMATIYANMAELYVIEGRESAAKNMYLESLALMLQIGREEFATAVVYNNLGELKMMVPDSAIEYLQTAQAIFQSKNYLDGIAHTHNNLAFRYLQIGQPEQAILEAEAAINIWEQADYNYTPGLVTTYSVKAEALGSMGQYEKGREFSEKSIQLAEKEELFATLKLAYDARARLEELNKNFEEALHFFKKSTTLNEQLLNEARTKQVAVSRIKFETEEKEKELAQNKLALERETGQKNLFLLLGIIVVVLLVFLFLFFRYRNQLKRKETELALQLKQKEAETLKELDTVKSRFFANISHEFRTPLTLILGPLQQMIEGTLKGSEGTHLKMMYRNGQRLLQLINQLLDLSRLESGRMELKLEQGDIVNCIRVLASQFNSLAESRGIHFLVNLPPNRTVVDFDRDKVEKIISNLLSNAMKFTPEEGEVVLKVTWEKELEISIRDNGIGMNAAQLSQVFDRFYQVESSGYGGSGIGLALVKELVGLMGGEVQVDSSPGIGSQFQVTLPIIAGEGDNQATDVLPVSSSFLLAPEKPARQEVQIREGLPLLLLVEDNEDVRTLLRSMFSEGFNLLMATNGEEGLQVARERIPDLILSDVMMPKMDGNEFTREIKLDERTSHIPVILLTAKAGQDSKLEGLELGADDFIPKPFDERELRVKIRNLLDQQARIRKKFGKDVVRLGPAVIEVNSTDQNFLIKVIGVIESYMKDESFTIEDLGREVGLSRSQLHRKLKGLTDQSPSVFLRSIRLQRAKQLLEQRAGTAAEISYLVGFGSPAYFSKCFKDEYGESPGEMMAR